MRTTARTARIRNVTIRDVADAAGVSIASVSRVINGLDNVAGETRKAVSDAIDRLNYVPHFGARALATRRGNLVGVILPDIHGDYFSELMRGIDIAARECGFHLLVASSHGDAREALGLIREMRGRVDGIILMAPLLDLGAVIAALPLGLKAVIINGSGLRKLDTISIDNYAGAAAAVRHLLNLGRRNIAHIAGPDGNAEAKDRRAGYLAALEEIGADPIVLPGDFSLAAGVSAGEAIASARLSCDAVFAANDLMALGCMTALGERGVRVPDDVAIVGFDDIPLARVVAPSLTTISANIAGLGREAMTRVALRVAGGASEIEDQVISADLVVRKSCGADSRREDRSGRPRGASITTSIKT